MSGIFSRCGVWLPFVVSAALMFVAIYLLFRFITNKPKLFWTIFITAVLVSIFTLATNKFIFPRLAKIFFPRQASKEWIVYDTDPRNDEFIKGVLKYEKLKRLDFVLMKEKENNGLRLSTQELNEYAKYDNDIIEAYNRWRKCKDMRRSHHRVIYPDERNLYHYLK